MSETLIPTMQLRWRELHLSEARSTPRATNAYSSSPYVLEQRFDDPRSGKAIWQPVPWVGPQEAGSDETDTN